MIEVTANQTAVPMQNLQKMLYSDELIKALATQLVAGQVEAHLEMISDYGDEYKNFTDVESVLLAARDTAPDYAEDLLSDFRDKLYEAMTRVNITVKAAKFSKEGVIDADILIS